MACSMMIDLFGPSGKPCVVCALANKKQDILDKITPDKILDLTDISFIPKDDHPVG